MWLWGDLGRRQFVKQDKEADEKRRRRENAKTEIEGFLQNYQQELETIKAQKRAERAQIEGNTENKTKVA